jgi:asparagine synthase (glutamine-hydrolysing)
MARALAFRGPDGTSVWTQGTASFCFTFLRTGPAAQAEKQPVTLDGQTWLLGQVRLDGRDDVIRWLNQSGVRCKSEAPDEELVLHAWNTTGSGDRAGLFQERLIGDYSFVLWQQANAELVCVRSLIGSYPFFYAQANGRFFFSNTLEVLRLGPEISGALDSEFIGDFLLHGWCPAWERTVYRDIRRLPPGHALTVSGAGTRLIRVARLPIEDPLWRKRSEDYIEEFQALLRQAVHDRVPGDSSVVFMSGGLDSTTVAATAKEVLNASERSRLSALCVGFRRLFEDPEPDAAALVAEHLGLPMDFLEVSDAVPFIGWDSPGFRMPEPLSDPFHAMVMRQFQMAGSKARVVLNGDGGDDVLLGSAWPYLKYLISRGKAKTLVKTFGGYFLRHGRIPPLRAGILSRVKRWMRTQGDPEYPLWLNPRFEEQRQLKKRWPELNGRPAVEHPVHPMGYAAFHSPFWAQMREYDDSAWTSSVVETRAPLMDVRLLKFELRLPPVPWCIDKRLVRLAMTGRLPEQIRRRPKVPLAKEPLDLFVGRERWRPSQFAVSETIQDFVDWKKWQAASWQTAGSRLLTDIRPVALDRWLKNIETHGQIK